jgi:hypothetical protein
VKSFKIILAAMLTLGMAGMASAQDIELPDNPDKTFRTAEGQEVRQYMLEVKAVGRRHVTVEFSDGSRHTYRVPNDFRFNIDGTPTPLSGIYPRQKLRAYFYYNQGEWQMTQPADFDVVESEPVEIVAVADQAPEEDLMPVMDDVPEMPKTAGTLPMIALIGLVLLAAAGGLRMARVRRF